MSFFRLLIVVSALGAAGSALGGANHPQGSQPPPPHVWSVSPSSGPPGTEVTITGLYFKAGAKVRVGGVEATVLHVTGSQIVATVGHHKPGRALVSVENPDGRSGARGWAFRYLPEAEGDATAVPEPPPHA